MSVRAAARLLAVAKALKLLRSNYTNRLIVLGRFVVLAGYGTLSYVKLLILYRPNSDHATEVESYVRDFEHRRGEGGKMELVSINTRDGAAMATLYDVVMYPAILAIANDGVLLDAWQGKPLPLMDEIAAYVQH